MPTTHNKSIQNALDNIRQRAEHIVGNLTEKHIRNMCTDILGHAQMVSSIIPKTRFDEMFRNAEGTHEPLSDFRQRMTGVCNFRDWQIEIADVSDNGKPLTFMKQLVEDDGRHIISVIVPNENRNTEFVREFMEENRYVLLREYEIETGKPANNMNMTVMCFSLKNVY